MSSLGEMNDLTKVRTAEDVERKYRLDKVLKNTELNEGKIVNLENELNEFIDVTYANEVDNLQGQIDGKVETWYYSGVPSLSNAPANTWLTDDEKSKHIGDLYYNQATGYVYRFELDTGVTPNVYKWVEIHDEKAVNALSIANVAKDTADSKRRVFTSEPTTPYDNGDLWVQGSTGDIKACQVARATGSFVATDWILASKYTDNTYATAIVDELGGTTTTILSGQVVQEMANYTKFTDLATGGSTTIAGENITTGSIKSQNYVADTSGTKINLTDGTIDTKNFKVDSSGNITTSNAAITGGSLDLTAPDGTTSKIWVRTDDTHYLTLTPTLLRIRDSGSKGCWLTETFLTLNDGQGSNAQLITGAINLEDKDANDNPTSVNISANGGIYNGCFVANGVLADNLYSTSEKPIGTWIDGKKLWRKVFNVGNISSNTITINHGISNLDWVVQMYGTCKTGGTWYNLDRVSATAANQQVTLAVSATQLIVSAGTDANFSQGCYVVIEYTTT